MSCKISARLLTPKISGVLVSPDPIRGTIRSGAPIVDGWYSDGVRQTRQFQQVLEELRIQHQPEHWASWALDGSLEEDAGRFPLLMQGGWEWVDVGPRKAVMFDGSNDAGLYYGTDEDFAWVHEQRVFTIGVWLSPVEYGSVQRIIGTNDPASTTTNGFAGYKNNGRSYFDLPHTASFQRHISVAVVRPESLPQFYVWTGTGTGGEYRDFYGGVLSQISAIAGEPRMGHSYDPLTIGYRSTNTIWNCFVTSQVLTDAEILRLYVAGMADLME